MRVGIIGLSHESNTFMPRPTTLADFQRVLLARGNAVTQHYATAHHEITGFLQGLAQANLTPVPIFATRAVPSGTITADTLNSLLSIMMDELHQAGPLDGLLLAPHGAGVSENHPDMDGQWLTLVRNHVGPDLPIVCTLDPHANLTPRMVAACNATVAYRTNPHLDQRARGLEAAHLLARTLRGEIKPTQYAEFPRLAINIERQLTSASPCKELYAVADQMLAQPGILSNSIFLGFPYADVPEMGSAFLVVTDNDPALAERSAKQLAQHVWDHKSDFVGHLISPPDAIDLAMKSPRPACLLDMGDNGGGGGPCDGTVLAHLLHERSIHAFVSIFDPQSVAQAQAAGVGAKITLSMGGKTDDRHGRPLIAEVDVQWIGDGRFTESQARHGGNSNYNIGRTAVVRTPAGLTLQLTSLRAMPSSLNQLLFCGLDPASFDIIVAKGVHAPVAAYAPVCPTLIRVNTPGITTADMTALSYRNRRRPLFPFEKV